MTRLAEIAAAMQAESANKPFSWENAARAAVEAMREPTEGMMAAGNACDEMMDEFTATPKHAAECDVHWQAMIDAILSETDDDQ